MSDQDKDTDETYELSDVEVLTLGLVNQGANKAEFFLMKADNGADEKPAKEADAVNDQVVTDQSELDVAVEKASTSIWRKLLSLFKSNVEQELIEAEPPTYPITETVTQHTEQPLPDIEKISAEPETTTVATPAPHIPVTEETMTEQTTVQPVAVSDLLVEKMATLEKDRDDLRTRLEKAEREAAQERDARERLTYLEKAQSFAIVPVKPDELAEQLHWLAKTEPKREQFWEGILKAMDTIAKDNAFIEVGTSKSPAEMSVLEKAQSMVENGKAKSLKEALLAIPKNEQEAYVKSRRQAVREV
jgi:hypothetical protein